MKKVLVIVGPTASGKSALAVRLAKKFNGEIISADSRQVYKGLNLGTGKITKREMKGIPHYLLDVVSPSVQFSVSDYKKLAEEKIRYIVEKGKLPIVVGGSGFYIDALTGTISLPNVPPNKTLRKKLEYESVEKIFQILLKKDQKRALAIGRHNKVRLIRALEIIEKLGKVPTVQHRVSDNFIYIGLKPDNLDERIRERLVSRLPGIIRESKRLIRSKKLTYKRMRQLGLEYRYTALHLVGRLSLKEMEEKLYREIRRYAKRQKLWFKRNKKIKWFTLSAVEGFRPEEYRKIESYLKKN